MAHVSVLVGALLAAALLPTADAQYGWRFDQYWCYTRVKTWEQFLERRWLHCDWDAGRGYSFTSRCNGPYGSACTSREECTAYSFGNVVCGPSLPKLTCMRLTQSECESNQYRNYCRWGDSGGWTACHPHTPSSAPSSPFICELHTSQNSCEQKSGCVWTRHPDDIFNYCTPQGSRRACYGGDHPYMCYTY